MSNATMMTNPRSVAVTQPTIPPLPPINVPLPEKMEIRVVEYTKGLRLVKTELQYRMWHLCTFEHHTTSSQGFYQKTRPVFFKNFEFPTISMFPIII